MCNQFYQKELIKSFEIEKLIEATEEYINSEKFEKVLECIEKMTKYYSCGHKKYAEGLMCGTCYGYSRPYK